MTILCSKDDHGKLNEYKAVATVLLTLVAWQAHAQTHAYSWSQVMDSAQWAGRCSHAVVEFQGKLWLLGGFDGSKYLSDVWASADGTTWSMATSAAPWSGRVTRGRTAVFQGKLWVVGDASSPNDIWNSADGANWLKVASDVPWGLRVECSVIAFQEKLCVFGGGYGLNRSGSNDMWTSGDGLVWNQVVEHASWPARYTLGGGIAFGNRLWVLGGYTYLDDSRRQYWLHDVWSTSDGVSWSQASGVGIGYTCRLTEFDQLLWDVDRSTWESGYGGGVTASNEVWVSSDVVHWERMPDSPWSRRLFQASAAFNGALWVFGGEYNSGATLNDVWRMSVVPVTVEGDARAWHRVGEGLTLTVVSPETPSKLSAGVGYQWMLNGVTIAGATEYTYHVDALEESDSGAYTCVLTGDVFGTAGPFQVNVVEGPIPVAGLAGLIAAAFGILLGGLALRRKMGK